MRILAIDYGKKRIGLAISDPFGSYALPLCVLENKKGIFLEIKNYCDKYEITTIVLGLPKTLTGEMSFSVQETNGFADKLKLVLKIPIERWDERLTSKIAEKMLISSGVKRDDRKASIDKISACLILNEYLEKNAK